MKALPEDTLMHLTHGRLFAFVVLAFVVLLYVAGLALLAMKWNEGADD